MSTTKHEPVQNSSNKTYHRKDNILKLFKRRPKKPQMPLIARMGQVIVTPDGRAYEIRHDGLHQMRVWKDGR